MTLQSEQNSGRVASVPQKTGPHASLHVDPPIACENWVLVRGHVALPTTRRSLDWLLRRGRRRAAYVADGTALEVRLPEDATARPLVIQPDGSFEARFAAHLPRLRAAERKVWFTLRSRKREPEKGTFYFS